jgi:hypothetical protein
VSDQADRHSVDLFKKHRARATEPDFRAAVHADPMLRTDEQSLMLGFWELAEAEWSLSPMAEAAGNRVDPWHAGACVSRARSFFMRVTATPRPATEPKR